VGVLQPSSGFVRIDDADLFDQNSQDIGKFIGYLPQDVELFKGSIKDNIARMQENISDEKIIAAAKFCGIHELILKFPQGYESFINKDANNLSGGQKQRIALARAFFGDVKFVVLDEPNSNLDSAGEVALIETLKKAKEKKITTIIITHKPSIAKVCDKIMVLQDGQIKVFDEADKVIAKTLG